MHAAREKHSIRRRELKPLLTSPQVFRYNHQVVSPRRACRLARPTNYARGDVEIAKDLRVNERIRAREVRLIDENGAQVGIVSFREALDTAKNRGLDLIEVSPTADPPVCRIMDYGKYKYEKAKKAKEARKKQHVVHLKEIKLHPKTEEHDYGFKMKHARDFLMRGDRVKATVVFRGREITHIEFGRQILERFDKDIADLAMIELSCKMEGRNMISMYVPDRAKIKDVQRKIDQEKKRQEAEAAVATQAAGTPGAMVQEHEKPAA